MNQNQADELFSIMRDITVNIDALMNHEVTASDMDIRKKIGEMSGNFCSWLDFEFLKLVNRKFPEISTKKLDATD